MSHHIHSVEIAHNENCSFRNNEHEEFSKLQSQRKKFTVRTNVCIKISCEDIENGIIASH